MTERVRLRSAAPLAAAVLGVLGWSLAQASDPPSTETPAPVDEAGQTDNATAPATSPPAEASPLGWSAGTVAAGTASVLSPVEPMPLAIPDAVAAQVTGETALFYFSPTCGHCRAAMPDVTALQGRGDIGWVGVATSSATPEAIAEFRDTFEVSFPILSDTDGAFSRAVGARSTPSVYVVRPIPTPAEGEEVEPDPIELLNPTPEGFTKVLLTQAFPPFVRGAGPVLLMRAHLERPFADFDGYQGDVVCQGCHEQEALSMAVSHHSVALYTLYKREKHDDPECVSCHVTGMGEPGGFVMGDLSHPLAGVQCEACHGPAGPHDGTSTDARSQCVTCHDAEHSIAFSVEKGLPHIDHFQANGLTEDELRARLQAIADGTADKPLLAFPDGPTVGASACWSCHDAAHGGRKEWRKTPHAKAMKALRKDDKAADPGCVSCHATQLAYGLGVSTSAVEDFRTDDGVGCESCHGPASAHVEDPRKDNIVGLGESCPECVVEAICTGCHTPEWDADWDLQTRLDAVK